jgi:ribosomal protein S18 acetylase RimI-like enzyme
MSTRVHVARRDEAAVIGRLLDAFNREFDDPTPGASAIGRRVGELMAGGDTVILLVGDGPDGIAVLRFRASIWYEGLECYLAELYVVPSQRRRGLGRELMETAFSVARERGAVYMDLNTSEADVAAIALYERLGFSSREGRPDGPRNLYYEREL